MTKVRIQHKIITEQWRTTKDMQTQSKQQQSAA